MRARRRATAALVSIVAAGAFGAPARADSQPLCRLSPAGPIEYQRTLGPLVSGFVAAPPAPGRPASSSPSPASTGIGAGNLAREALGGQFSMYWLSNAVQGWVVGLAPGPLDPAAARAAIVERIAAHYTAEEVAHLSERLHVDPQSYSEAELRATQDALVAALLAERGPLWGVGTGCRLSDARRIELTVYSPATPEQFLRVMAIAEPHGDKVRIELVPHGPPMPAIQPLPPPPRPPPPQQPRPQPVAFDRHVKMALLRRCVRGREVRIAARAGQPRVTSLTVSSGGRLRTIVGKRLAKPLVVKLRARRTEVAVTVRLADGRTAGRTVTYARCR